MAQLAEGSPSDTPAVAETSPADNQKAPHTEDAAFVVDQQRLWTDRIAQAELAQDESVVVELLRQWLQAKDYALLAKAIFVFGDRLSLAFSSDGELAVHKVEFAEYMRSLDERLLPSDAEFFRKLNHHAISSSLLAQSDAEIYRSLREEFGSSGVAQLIKSLSPRQGALVFALVPDDFQHEVVRSLSPQLRAQVASQLLTSNRISKEEQSHVFAALDAARAGLPLPPPPAPTPHGIADRGQAFDAAGALSVLFGHMEPAVRKALLSSALDSLSGVLPLWYQDILYPEMILKVPQELRADMLLEVDIKGLAGYGSAQSPAWQERFMGGLAPTMQNAMRAHQGFGSRAEQVQAARLGRRELVAAIKRLVAAGKVSFPELVS